MRGCHCGDQGLMVSPTERWGAWLGAAETDENLLMFTFVRDVVLQDLKKEGLLCLLTGP